MTLVELVIVMAIMSLLLLLALPNYQSYMLRVHRSDAVRMLLQAAICQEKIYANLGSYDIGLCQSSPEQKRYKLTFQSAERYGQVYIATATPQGAQQSDPCGSLSLDQSGNRTVSNTGVSVMKCWNGR